MRNLRMGYRFQSDSDVREGLKAFARETRKGKFEQAQGGTLFLDEISTMEEETQVALLRVLETRRIQRVGGKRLRRVDIRLICASNRDNFMSWSADAYLLKSSNLTSLKNTIKDLIGCAHPRGTSGEDPPA